MSLIPYNREEQTLFALGEGSQTAFAALIKAYKHPLAARILHILKSNDDTEKVYEPLERNTNLSELPGELELNDNIHFQRTGRRMTMSE